ncbi:hypothetical protein HD_0993 [[Haemophilus] ducreyi 35000HP]|uniref:Uncharacterized protein n=1 Tax=Haemophilus ducreyi (strain 35000HP / ATCC 700724) TaxID=233412 RepID=Q7VMI4_HAEDU|nr:hypothetical protein HD_0993 [[Haemophilus] ducreyi 35000HP]
MHLHNSSFKNSTLYWQCYFFMLNNQPMDKT